MKEFITKNGKTIKMGDKLTVKITANSPFGEIECLKDIIVSPNTIQHLIALGEIKPNNKEKVEDALDAVRSLVINNLSKKTGWKADKVVGILNTIDEFNSWAALQIVLKEIAIILDKNYPSHISDSPEVWAISPQDGRIHSLNKKSIKKYCFPAFRTLEDAKFACRLVKDNLKDIFNE